MGPSRVLKQKLKPLFSRDTALIHVGVWLIVLIPLAFFVRGCFAKRELVAQVAKAYDDATSGFHRLFLYAAGDDMRALSGESVSLSDGARAKLAENLPAKQPGVAGKIAILDTRGRMTDYHFNLPDEKRADRPQDAALVAYVHSVSTTVGEYQRGARARRNDVLAVVVDAQTQKVVGRRRFQGSSPPSSFTYREGNYPDEVSGGEAWFVVERIMRICDPPAGVTAVRSKWRKFKNVYWTAYLGGLIFGGLGVAGTWLYLYARNFDLHLAVLITQLFAVAAALALIGGMFINGYAH